MKIRVSIVLLCVIVGQPAILNGDKSLSVDDEKIKNAVAEIKDALHDIFDFVVQAEQTCIINDHSKELRELDEKQKAILILFEKSKVVTAKKVQEFFAISLQAAQALCLKWQQFGFLIVVDPSKKSRKYQLNKELEKKLFSSPLL